MKLENSDARRADNSGAKSKANEDGRLTSKLPPPPHFTLSALASKALLLEHPTVLMLGSEGEGLRWNLEKKADATVSIEGGWRLQGERGSGVDAGRVDSLNVSVAAGLLVEGFLRAPVTPVVDGAREGNGRDGAENGRENVEGEDAGEEGEKVAVKGELF